LFFSVGFAHGTCHAVGISVALISHRVLTNLVLITHKTVKAAIIVLTRLAVFVFALTLIGIADKCLHTMLFQSNAVAVMIII
jgi:hypothetical protein